MSGAQVESESISDFARIMDPHGWPGGKTGDRGDSQTATRCQIEMDQDTAKNGLGRLALTLVNLVHELLERQALRRIDAGSLSEEEIERLGLTLMRQAEEIDRLRQAFNLEKEDLNMDLGPLGKLL